MATSAFASNGECTKLLLTVSHSGINPNPQPEHFSFLTCHPSSGDHPRAHDACLELERAQGNFGKLQAKDGPCAKIYAPVFATAVGAWKGRMVSWRHLYGNRCEMELATGSVFAFRHFLDRASSTARSSGLP
ncbi:SSI family serine proteinase inhibitor [Streptomyces aureoversilis]|uniref:SSI family serine proteinase inhibitor n=1 Tax=Streptomyces aureoversilis TaxID=67277 RepID=A0ABW0A8W2_9ACTN